MSEKSLEKPNGLDDRAIAAKNSEIEAKALIEEFMPFLRSRVARYSSCQGEQVHEDLVSTAMMAFYEALHSYESDKGHFFPFANRVVSARIIDHIRKFSKHEGKTVSLDEDDEDRVLTQSSAINVVSIRNYEAEQRRVQLAQEIEQFKIEAESWGITIDSLARGSPKHRELRSTYHEIILKVSEDETIMETIHLKRYFPIKAISKLSGLSQKKLERARIYILASLLIKTGDYELLSEYII